MQTELTAALIKPNPMTTTHAPTTTTTTTTTAGYVPVNPRCTPHAAEAEAYVANHLATQEGVATLTKSAQWGAGPRTIARIDVGGWSYELQLAGLAADCGLSGPTLPGGSWVSVAIREAVEQHLHNRLTAVIRSLSGRVEQPTLAMERGAPRDLSMGWDSWPSGPESVANKAEVPA